MIDKNQIVNAKNKIATHFVRQCSSGSQLIGLDSSKYCACGQYLETGAKQRGLHGTAAALSVIAINAARGGTQESRDIVQKLISYSVERDQAEEKSSLTISQIEEDSNNVIKISELLWALSHVLSAIAKKEDAVKVFASKLQKSMLDGKGWGYFCEIDTKPSLLPTAYALMALDAHAYVMEGTVDYLITGVKNANENDFVKVFCLYVLVNLKYQKSLPPDFKINLIFDSLWDKLKSIMHQDFEQNLEFMGPDNEKHNYIRVPWQLYILAIAIKLWPRSRAFSSLVAQQRLEAIINAVDTNEGFIYQYSGIVISSRTNAILFSVLNQLNEEFPKHRFELHFFYTLDQMRRFLGCAWLRYIMWVSAGILMIMSIYYWRNSGGTWSDLGPEFFGFLITSILSLRKGK